MKNHYEHRLISKINENLNTCRLCEKCDTKGTTFLSANSNDIDIMFIAQNPGKSHHGTFAAPETITPFALHDDFDDYHYFFDLFIDSFKEKYKRAPVFYITNIIKSTTIDNTLKNCEEMIDKCMWKYLSNEILYFKVFNKNLKIVTLGKEAENNVISRFLVESKLDLSGTQIINIKHPGFLNRKGKEYIVNEVNKLMGKL